MFWGLIMEPNKRYTQTIENSFHVSMASLDLTNADDNMVQVVLHYEGRDYLLCSLKKGMVWQVPLDLNFKDGTKIAFTCHGHGCVHLTGYLIPDEDIDLQELEDEEDNIEVSQLSDAKQGKRKALHSPSQGKEAKRVKQELGVQSSDEEDDDSISDKDSDDSSAHDNSASASIEGEDEDEDNEDDDDDEYDTEDLADKKSAKTQWHEKKKKHIEELQVKKKDKQKLMNGKEAKQLSQEEQQSKRQIKNKKEHNQLQNQQAEQKKRVMEGGVQVEDLKIGGGMPTKPGKFVSVYYVGRLKNGKKFDATTQGEGFKFRLGKGEVIKGWDIGISGMKVGGKRRITIPPALAYGAKGSPPVIPGNSTLIFDVELKNVH